MRGPRSGSAGAGASGASAAAPRAPSQRLAGRAGASATRRPFGAESEEESDDSEAGQRRRGGVKQQSLHFVERKEQEQEIDDEQGQEQQQQQVHQAEQQLHHKSIERRGGSDSSEPVEEHGSGAVGSGRAARVGAREGLRDMHATCAALLRLVENGSDLNGVLVSEAQRRDLCSFLAQGPSCVDKDVLCRAMLSLDLLCSSRRPNASKNEAGAVIDSMWGDIKTLFNSLINQGPFAEQESEWLVGEAAHVEPESMTGRAFGPYGVHPFFVGLAFRFNLLFPARCYISVRDHVRSRLKRLRAGAPAPAASADSDSVDTDGPSAGSSVQRGRNKRSSDAANLLSPPALLSPPPPPNQQEYAQHQFAQQQQLAPQQLAHQQQYAHQQYAQQRAQPARRPYKLVKRASAHELHGEPQAMVESALAALPPRPDRMPTLRSSGKLKVLPLFRELPGARRAFAAAVSLCRDRDLELVKLLKAAHLRQAQHEERLRSHQIPQAQRGATGP
jgi:hypothetical protein